MSEPDAKPPSPLAGSVVSPLGPEDLGAVMALVHREGWSGYTIDDLRLIMAVSPEDCFKLVNGGALVGAIFALTIGRVSYLSFFLIDPRYRSLDSARALGLTCLTAVRQKAAVIATYANRRAVTAYKRSGFLPRQWVTRYRVSLNDSRGAASDRVRSLSIAEMAPLDARCYRQSRAALLDALSVYEGARVYGVGSADGERLLGQAMVRKGGGDTYYVGPVVAEDEEIASELIRGALAEVPSKTAFLELNDERLPSRAQGALTYARTEVSVQKMYLGDESALEEERLLYVIGGHHFS